jgi:hypothetical protein
MLVDFPLPDAEVGNNVRRHGYTLTITKPGGDTEEFDWDVVQDTTKVAFLSYTPDEAGEYTLTFEYAGQVYKWDDTSAQQAWYGVHFLPDTAIAMLTVLARAPCHLSCHSLFSFKFGSRVPANSTFLI